jgi:carbonic anhydrase
MSLDHLSNYIKGFERFQENWFKSDAHSREIFVNQAPKVLVISCSDSRVDPALLFDSDPGDFFMIRNVANLVPPYVKDSSFHGISATLEYAVRALNVQDIIILGHTHCGGIATLIEHGSSTESAESTEFLSPWLDIAKNALLRINVMEHSDKDAMHRSCEREAILVSLGNLLTFPWIKSRVDAGDLKIHGWYFNLKSGSLERWSPRDKKFIPLVKG